MKVTSCCRPRLPRTAVKALHWRSFFTLDRTEQPARTVHQGSDPHGDPIPDHNLKIHERATQSLADLEPGEHATIVRVSDSDPEMLRYLTSQGIAIGDPLELISRQPFDGPTEIRIKERTHNLGSTLAIRVQTT
jgi:DtxR family Mn-dependent transcriptional regulator